MSDPTQHRWPAGTRRLQVHDVQIDLRYRRVIRPDQEAELPQRMFELLLVFLAEPQVLHSRAELFARVWPGVIVEDANLSQSIWMLRKALGESRKHWIRTVAKSGYVFEPPGPVEAVAEIPAVVGSPPITNVSAVADAAIAAEPQPATGDGTTPRHPPPSRVWRRWLAAAVLAVAVIGGASWWLLHRNPPPTGSPAPQLAIALIDVEDQAAAEETRWPVTLLHAWLGWKLESLPEVTLLTEAHLAADSQAARRASCSSARAWTAPIRPTSIFLRARFDQGGREQRLEQKGTRGSCRRWPTSFRRSSSPAWCRAREGTMADARTRYRHRASLHRRRGRPGKRDWVASHQDPARRRRARAELRPRPHAVGPCADPAVARRAGHGADRSRARPAAATTQGRRRGAQAEQLARDPQRPAEAAAAFGELATRHPGKRSYALDQARMLRRAGQFKEALAILNQPYWDGETVGNRLRPAPEPGVHLLLTGRCRACPRTRPHRRTHRPRRRQGLGAGAWRGAAAGRAYRRLPIPGEGRPVALRRGREAIRVGRR